MFETGATARNACAEYRISLAKTVAGRHSTSVHLYRLAFRLRKRGRHEVQLLNSAQRVPSRAMSSNWGCVVDGISSSRRKAQSRVTYSTKHGDCCGKLISMFVSRAVQDRGLAHVRFFGAIWSTHAEHTPMCFGKTCSAASGSI
jgi:hypothetical protein